MQKTFLKRLLCVEFKMPLSEIKRNLKTSRLVIGTNIALKQLKLGRLSKIFLSSNCPPSLKKDVAYYCGLGACAVESLDVPNEELGIACKKPFPVSVVGIFKQ